MKYSAYSKFLTDKGKKYNPLKKAIIYDGGYISYKELATCIVAFTGYLKERKIGSGDVIALAMGNVPEFVPCLFSILQRGAIVFPINPKSSACEIKAFLLEAQVSTVICADKDYPGSRMFGGTAVTSVIAVRFMSSRLSHKEIYCSQSPNSHQRPQIVKNREDAFCIRQYSSGSTGRPKHMLLTFRNLFYQAFQFTDALSLREKEIFAAVVPFFHSYGLLNILAAFRLGATLLIIKNFLPHKAMRYIDACKATVLLATPFMLDMLASSHKDKGEKASLGTLRFCVSSTGLLRKEIYQSFYRRYKVPVFVQYGSTETGAATIGRIRDFKENVVGKPMRHVQVKIFDSHFKHLNCGIGKIGIKSPAACRGYLSGNDQGRVSFRKGYVFPGDIGYIDNIGALHVVGRDDIINVGGFKVDRLEVECAITSMPDIKDAVVYGVCEGSTEIVRAAVIVKKRIPEKKILAYLKKRLADYKIPKKIIYVDKFPQDEKGKILKRQLEKLS